ncbi:hypothetical protein SAMN05421788_105176 [Filimonas lacunae]|uniref:Uncharacterized protein n=1 Tax=Filimonas lacunae TaxID=477680 RepID=A0A173MD17_9BACT|nr:type VI secretion system TssO [Filimonas lacunae]BAV05369.1 hypothetical protein FLA_1376 [Filimonas lacunae]SIT21676.1 hypothetical protein SAMN05421788_105176 [Filimonas lacunae]
MRPVNYENIKNKTLIFWGYFILLIICAFVPVLLFFKSYNVQKQYIADDILACKKVLNKQIVLHNKVDSLYSLMQMLNANQVRSDLFLEKYIADNKKDITRIIDADSAAFQHYSLLLTEVDKMLMLKDSIRNIVDREQLALKDLSDCIKFTRKIQNDLTYDPQRNFSSAR